MGPKEEPGMLALLIALGAALYALAWLLAGPPDDQEVSAHASAARAVEVSLPSR
jgi:hypothetical protein